MVQDIDIKSKRILLFDFDGTLIETASGNTFATDLTDMRIKMDVVNKALDLMQENGVKVFAIVSNQGGVEAGFVSGADIEAKIEYVLRCVRSGFGPAYGEGAGDRPVSVRLRCVE